MLSAKDLQLDLPGFALRAADVRLGAGEGVWLQGVNGAGKSMLLRSLAGIFQARSREQRIGAHPLADEPVAYKRQIVYAGNARRAYAHLTVQAALDFASQFYDGWRADRVVPLAQQVALPLTAKVANLSQGMTAKLNFLIAACSGAKVLLIDELLAPVDAEAKQHMAEFFAGELQRGAALIYCSHSEDEVTALLSRRWQMRDGALCH